MEGLFDWICKIKKLNHDYIKLVNYSPAVWIRHRDV